MNLLTFYASGTTIRVRARVYQHVPNECYVLASVRGAKKLRAAMRGRYVRFGDYGAVVRSVEAITPATNPGVCPHCG